MGEFDPEPPEPRDHEGRTPPQNRDAERAVLGSMMLSVDVIGEVIEHLRGADYYQPAHEFIHDVIVEMYGQGLAPDVVTVAAELTERGWMSKIAGGAVYVHSLVESPSLVPANAAHYAMIVKGMATLRRYIDAGSRIMQRGYKAEGDVDQFVDWAQAELFAAAPTSSAEDYAAVSEIVEETLDAIEALGNREGGVHGVPTGFADLDDLFGGLQGGQMVIVAARPAVGKSTLGLDFMRSAAIHHNMTSCFFSLEMTRQEIVMRLLSAEAKVPLNNIRNGKMGDHDWARVAGAMPQVSRAPLFIDDSPNMTMTQIRSKARRLKQQHDLRFIVIDYLQLMSSGRKVESRQLEVSEFSRQIKLLAKELDVPIIAISQLNRGVESRSDKRPMMSDLRESGSLEQDADIVILLNREDSYMPESSRPGEADLIVAKHRNGPTRDVVVAFQGHYSRFVDMARM